jgi:hypothetical protein
MKSLEAGELSIAVEQSAGALKLHWQGRSNARDPGAVLAPFFSGVLDAAAAQGSEVQMHFEQLAQFNSSTIAAVIQAIHAAREKGVSVVLCYSGQVKWQALSFEAIRRAMKHFETAGGPAIRIVATDAP